MSTIREQCTVQVLAQLNGAGKPAGVPATVRAGTASARLPNEAAGHESMILKKRSSGGSPTALVQPDRPGGRGGPLARHYFTLELEMRAAGDGTIAPDTLVEDQYAWAVKALVDTNLNGLALGVHEGPSLFPEMEQGEYPGSLLVTQFIVEHTTRVNDAELKA